MEEQRFEPAPRTVAGKYAIIRLMGEGGMGKVYEAVHIGLDQRVALKILSPDAAHKEGVARRFRKEGRLAAKLKGEHAVRVHDVDTDENGRPFLVMEYLHGRDLGSELKTRGRLPVGEAVDLILQACSGLAEAHTLGIVHRDLKPQNLFLLESGAQRVVKVLDFGISQRRADDSAVTSQNTITGTPAYMPPEQLRGEGAADVRSDVWSLGVVLYRAVTGELPFSGQDALALAVAIAGDAPRPIGELAAGLPRKFRAVVMRALEKDIRRRFQSIDELARALLPFAANPACWNPPGCKPAPALARRSHRAWAVVAAISTLLLLGTVVVLLRRPPSVVAGKSACSHTYAALLPSGVLADNFVWGATTRQCLATRGDGFVLAAAEHDLPFSGPPASGPALLVGCREGRCAPHPKIPAAVESLSGLRVSWRATTTPGQGAWNVNLTLRFATSGKPDRQPHMLLMLWLAQQGDFQPFGHIIDRGRPLAAADWEVWHGDARYRYLTYRRATPITSMESADLMPFIEDALRRHLLEPTWHLVAIEAGFEIWRGGQGLAADDLQIDLH